MNDWRTKPRNGRTEFIKYSEDIKAQIKSGMTNKQIYDKLHEKEKFPLSQSQFNRYVRKYFPDVVEEIRNTHEKESVSHTIKTDINGESSSAWHNINIHTKRLINDLEESGFTPDEVALWNEPNDTAIRNRLIQMTLKKWK